jgi:hypothetical protein
MAKRNQNLVIFRENVNIYMCVCVCVCVCVWKFYTKRTISYYISCNQIIVIIHEMHEYMMIFIPKGNITSKISNERQNLKVTFE